MTLLNLTAFTPQTAYGVCCVLDRLGGTAKEKELEAWMSPASIYPTEGVPKTAGRGLSEAVSLCETLGLVDRDGESLTCCLAPGSLGDFRRIVLKKVLAPDLNVDLFSKPPQGGMFAHELTRALAWFGQLTATYVYSTANYEQYQSAGFRVIENNTRWNVFDRWVVFLGFGWRLGDGLISDPTEAIRVEVDDLLPESKETPLPSFLVELAERLPVLDGGAYHSAYLAATNGESTWNPRRLAQPLSLALIRLEKHGILTLSGSGDAEARVLRVGSDVDRSHQYVTRRARTEGEDDE